MKKIVALSVVLSLFMACSNDQDKKSPGTRDKDDYSVSDKKETDSKDRMTDGDGKTPAETDKGNTDSGPTEQEGRSWSSSEENKFMRVCEGTATEKVGAARANEYCDCVLQKLKRIYPSYADADRKLQEVGADEKLAQITDECNGR
jgi:hypothetical protein